MSLLYSPTKLGSLALKNRLVMSPMTRSRSLGNVPGELAVEYYKQRAASAGLIITEGTSPSLNGLGYPRIPGIFSAAQVEGWKPVTAAVHAGGTMDEQLAALLVECLERKPHSPFKDLRRLGLKIVVGRIPQYGDAVRLR